MGEFATTVQEYLCASLAENYPSKSWTSEFSVGGTPVDIGGKMSNQLYLIELEWRRADPADNAAKIFRHLQAETIDSEQVIFFQVFSNYYELSRGGVSSKRKNAEFIGSTASRTFETLSYSSIDFDLDPPKRGDEWPSRWKDAADNTIRPICELIGSENGR